MPIGIAAGRRGLEEKASMKARFIYPVARNLVETYNYKFSHAIVIAEKCYSRLPVQYQADAVAAEADAAEVHDEAIAAGPADEAPSDEEPPDFRVHISSARSFSCSAGAGERESGRGGEEVLPFQSDPFLCQTCVGKDLKRQLCGSTS